MSTPIQWTDETWNPIRGCSRVSEGCRNCYAEAIAARFSGPGLAYEGLARRRSNGEPQWTGEVRVISEHLYDPLHWRRPRRVFVNSMSDLFHDQLDFDSIAHIFAVMALARQHTYQVLTKRAAGMRETLSDPEFPLVMREHAGDILAQRRIDMNSAWDFEWPLPHVWLGTSTENQAAADERIPALLRTPAAVRWISGEPLLDGIDLTSISLTASVRLNALTGGGAIPALDWVVVGGESGPNARPCDVNDIGRIIYQCRAHRVPCFVKQLGALPVDNDCDLGRQPTDADAQRVRRIRRAWDFDHTDGLPNVLDLKDSHGGDPAEWPPLFRVREFPERAS